MERTQSQLFQDEKIEQEESQYKIVEVRTVMNLVQEVVELEQSSHFPIQMEQWDTATNTEHSDTEAVSFEVGDTVGEVDDIQQSNVWTVPTAEEIEQCDQCWISGPVELAEPLDEKYRLLSDQKAVGEHFLWTILPWKVKFPF